MTWGEFRLDLPHRPLETRHSEEARLFTRFALLTTCLVSAAASAKPKSVMMEFRSVPASPKAAAQMLEKEKPGAFRSQLFFALEQKLREKGAELENSDAIDAMTGAMFEKILEEMAAPTDVWVWSGDDGPRGDVLIRKTLKLIPGRNSSGFTKTITVSPKGKRIDRGYLNTPCTVEVSIAKTEADWFAESEGRGNWVAHLHPVMASEGVARVAVQLLSPGRGDPPAPKHERPVWVGIFRQESDTAPWTLVAFDGYSAKEQKLQEANVLPDGPMSKLSDQQKQLVLALRMEDVRLINPNRKVLSQHEVKWVSLVGLNGDMPVDAKHVAWLEPYRTSAVPMVKAVAILRAAQLGAPATVAEALWILETVKAMPVQAEALGLLARLVESSTEAVAETDKAVLTKGGGEDPKVREGVARVRVGGKNVFYKKSDAGWALIAPAK